MLTYVGAGAYLDRSASAAGQRTRKTRSSMRQGPEREPRHPESNRTSSRRAYWIHHQRIHWTGAGSGDTCVWLSSHPTYA